MLPKHMRPLSEAAGVCSGSLCSTFVSLVGTRWREGKRCALPQLKEPWLEDSFLGRSDPVLPSEGGATRKAQIAQSGKPAVSSVSVPCCEPPILANVQPPILASLQQCRS